MRAASMCFAAAIIVGLVAAVLGIPFNGGAGFLLIILWLAGVLRLVTVREGDRR
jgi:hypothetical protein